MSIEIKQNLFLPLANVSGLSTEEIQYISRLGNGRKEAYIDPKTNEGVAFRFM